MDHCELGDNCCYNGLLLEIAAVAGAQSKGVGPCCEDWVRGQQLALWGCWRGPWPGGQPVPRRSECELRTAARRLLRGEARWGAHHHGFYSSPSFPGG